MLAEDTASKTLGVGVLNRADLILRLLMSTRGGLGLKEIAAGTGMKRPTCHRLLQTLCALEYVGQGGRGGKYRLGMRLLEYGEAVRLDLDLRTRAYPVLCRLADQTEETIYLAVRSGDWALCIERIAGRHVGVQDLQVGGRLPLHLGAISRCLMAALSDEEIAQYCARPLSSLTPMSPTTKEKVWALIADVRRNRYATSHEDVTVGVNAIGAPIRDYSGKTVASVSLSGIVQRIGGDHEPPLIGVVQAAAADVSRSLGFTGTL